MIDIVVKIGVQGKSLVVPLDDYSLQCVNGIMERKNGFARIRVDAPNRAKTSPENRLFHALVAQLAMYRETTPDLMKRYVKIRGCAHGYPYEAFDDGDGRKSVEPKSVADATTVELAILIDTCYLIAHEWRFELKGDSNG